MSPSQRFRRRAIPEDIPPEIQEEIIKKLPVKQVIRFRPVSKQWKSLIDSSKFIKNYHVNHANPKHLLLVETQSDNSDEVKKYISIIDDDTFPNHKFPLTFPRPQGFSDHFRAGSGHGQRIQGSSQGIIYISCDGDNEDMAVLWNPTVRKSIAVVIPATDLVANYSSVVSFGVCPNSNDPKLVQLIVYNNGLTAAIKREAKVFTLSTKVWKSVTIPSTLFNNDVDFRGEVCTQGFIYFLIYDRLIRSNMIVSFDLRSEEFGQVYLPESLLQPRALFLSKRNECLTLLEAYNVDDVHVWMMNDSVTKSFTKIFTLQSVGHFGFQGIDVLEFRKNGKAIIRKLNYVVDEDTGISLVEVYNPVYHDQVVYGSAFVSSYMETLLLMDEADSIIYR